MTDQPISLNDLSDQACFALTYAQAFIADVKRGRGQPLSPKEQRELAGYKKACTQLDRAGISSDDRRRALAKGIAELMAAGVLDCERDGEGTWVPTVLHEERIRPAAARLVTRDMM